MKMLTCLNPECPLRGKVGSGRIIRYGFYRTKSGKRRRYRCVECGMTFSSTKGTPYYRLQHRRATLDAVVALRVEGVSISAVARVDLFSSLAIDELHGVGRRSYRNTLALVRDVADRMDYEGLPLIVTVGFDFYEKSVTESAAFSGRPCSMRRS